MKKLLSIFLVFILALLPFSVFAETDPDSFDMAVVNEIMKNTDIFNLKARSAILIDAKTGMVLYEKNAFDTLSGSINAA